MVYRLNEIKNIVSDIVKDYDVKRVFLFGSYARSEASDESDIDLLIDADDVMGLFQLSGLRNTLEDNLNVYVDVITNGDLDEDFEKNLKKEKIIIYER